MLAPPVADRLGIEDCPAVSVQLQSLRRIRWRHPGGVALRGRVRGEVGGRTREIIKEKNLGTEHPARHSESKAA
jgi:hypothetical protein